MEAEGSNPPPTPHAPKTPPAMPKAPTAPKEKKLPEVKTIPLDDQALRFEVNWLDKATAKSPSTSQVRSLCSGVLKRF